MYHHLPLLRAQSESGTKAEHSVAHTLFEVLIKLGKPSYVLAGMRKKGTYDEPLVIGELDIARRGKILDYRDCLVELRLIVLDLGHGWWWLSVGMRLSVACNLYDDERRWAR
jgi:hypothetical protein